MRRYQLVLVNRLKLKLVDKVAECFSSQSKHHKPTRSRFFPLLLRWTSFMGVQPTRIGPPCGSAPPTMGILVHRNRETKVDFAQAVYEGPYRRGTCWSRGEARYNGCAVAALPRFLLLPDQLRRSSGAVVASQAHHRASAFSG